jgi:purine-binding chemotaxis protein CheW
MSNLPNDPAVAELLRRRAEALRAIPPEPEDELRLVWAAVCTVGDASFAFPLAALRGILPLSLVTPVPLAGPHVVGLTRFQGHLVTVLSLASLLGGRAWATDPTNILILEMDLGGAARDGRAGSIAVDCTDVPRTVALAPRDAEGPAPAPIAGSPAWLSPVRTADGEVVQWIDVELLVQKEVLRGRR